MDSPDWDFDGELEPEEGPDPGTVAFLDQETAQFNDSADKFEETFGFKHACTCAADYTAGKLAETTHCFGRLCQDALTACKELKQERDTLRDIVKTHVKEEDVRDHLNHGSDPS